MSERGNEFELWPGRFLSDHRDSYTFSLAGWPPSTFRVAETRSEIHKRIGQFHILDRIMDGESEIPAFGSAIFDSNRESKIRNGTECYMDRQLCVLDICGMDIRVIITDDKKLLGSKRGKPSFGRYSIDQGIIWLDASLAPSVLGSHLFHEVYEFVLGYFNVMYHPGREHESFMRFSNVLWGVFKANQDILFGDKLIMLTA